MIKQEYFELELKSSIQIKKFRELRKNNNIKRGDIIKVHYTEIGKGNKDYGSINIEAVCDYCGKEFKITVRSAIDNYLNKYNNKNSCKGCHQKKTEETNFIKYGVKNVFMVKEHQEKQKKSVLEKYGCENVFQNEGIKEKSKRTLMEKYGVEHAMRVEKIKKKALKKSRETMSKNGTVNTSKNQIHINDLIGGKINYPFDDVILDIAFPEEKIYIEYNGGGHDLSVKIGRETEDEFLRKEIRRYMFLKSKGWKQIVICSPHDYLPKDELLVSEIKSSIDKIKNTKDLNHIKIDIGSKIISEKYGRLQYSK